MGGRQVRRCPDTTRGGPGFVAAGQAPPSPVKLGPFVMDRAWRIGGDSVSRWRKFVWGGLFVAATLPAWAAETLRVLTWPGYADADFVRRFEQLSGARVEVSLVGSDDVLWQKVSADAGGAFDVFAVNTAELQRYIDARLVQPLVADELPNRRYQSGRFRDLESIPGLIRDGRLYAIPYAYAEMGLIYDRKAVPAPPASLAVLWDARYRGRVLAYDGGAHNFSLAAIRLGKASPFRLAEADWRPAVDTLVALRRNVLAFYTQPDESVELFLQNRGAILFANYGTQQLKLLQQAGVDAGYVIPREGALAWLDVWAVTRGARNPALAKAWIDFTLSPEVSGALSRRHGLGNTLQGGAPDAGAARLIWLEPVEDPGRRSALWQRIVSGDRTDRVLAR